MKESVAFLVTCFCLLQVAANAQGLESRLDGTEVEARNIEAPYYSTVFANIALRYDVPLGFIQGEVDETDSASYADLNRPYYFPVPPNINIKSGSIRYILDQLAGPHTGYSWMVENEALLVFPTLGADPYIMDLLDSPVRSETVCLKPANRTATWGILVSNLLDTSILPSQVLASDDCRSVDKEVAAIFRFEKMTVRAMLDRVVIESSYNFWQIKKWQHNGKQRISIILQ